MVDIPNANKSQAGPNYFFLLLIILIVIGGTCVYFYPYVKDTLFPADKKTASLSGEETPYADFGERVAIAINNINFANLSQQRQDVAALLSDNLVTSYQKYFYAPDFQRIIADRRIYITFQKIQRTTVNDLTSNSAVVQVTGFNTYRSDVSQTQKEVPYTMLTYIQKKNDGTFVCSKLKKL